jgi:hypothetical protein
MKKQILSFLVASVVAQIATAADLVVNGSFESPDLTTAPGHIDRASGENLTVPPGASSIPSWKVIGAPVSILRTPYNDGNETLLAGEGLQCADLTGETLNGQGGLEQKVPTAPGRNYVLTFQLGVYPGSVVYQGPIRVQVSAGAATAEFKHDGTATVAGGLWQAFALPFHAITASTVIRFQNLQAANWCGLDRVAIAEVSPAGTLPNLSLVSGTIAGGGGVSTGNDHRFSLSGTIGQATAGLIGAAGKHLAAGFWGPVNRLSITPEGAYVRISWDFGLGFGELQTTDDLLSSWTAVSLAGNARSVMLPATEAKRFFRMLEN